MKLQEDQRALLIFDQFKGQVTEKMFKHLEENHVNIVVVPANCTDRLQPLDVSVNKPVKSFLHKQFQEWYAQKICEQLREPPTHEQLHEFDGFWIHAMCYSCSIGNGKNSAVHIALLLAAFHHCHLWCVEEVKDHIGTFPVNWLMQGIINLNLLTTNSWCNNPVIASAVDNL